jgi:glycosyltransferase A (GT-A) superfamily protein (DUF2064 family)
MFVRCGRRDDVFSGITISTPLVLAQTQAKAAAAGLPVHLLPPSFDIDEESDVVQLRALLAEPEWTTRLSATAAELRDWP